MKISHFCWGVELSSAVTYLGVYGVVGALLVTTIASYLIYPHLFLVLGGHVVSGVSALIVAGVSVFLLIQVGWITFSCFLLKKNRSNDIIGVKCMIKIANFIIGSVQAVLSAIAIFFSIGFIIYYVYITSSQHEEDPYYQLSNLVTIGVLAVIFIISLLILSLASMLLHGVRTNSPNRMKPWIIFKIVLFCFFLVGSLVTCVNFGILYGLLKIVLGLCNFLYVTGFVVVYYNILLENEGNDTKTQMIKNMEFSNPMADKLPAYSEVLNVA